VRSDGAPEHSELLQGLKLECTMIATVEGNRLQNSPFLTPERKKPTKTINKTTLREKGKKLQMKLN